MDKDYAGKVHGQNLDATTEENEKICKELGFSSHGLAIRSADGKVLWKQADHDVNMDDVKKAVADLLKK